MARATPPRLRAKPSKRTPKRRTQPPAIRTARPIYAEHELRALSIAEQQARGDALTAASYMRTKGFSRARAAREVGLTPRAVSAWLGPSLQKHDGRWTIKKTDKQVRILKIITKKGVIAEPIYHSGVASKLSQYANAVRAALAGDVRALRPFRGKSFRTGGKREFPFITDLALLKRLHYANALHRYHLCTTPPTTRAPMNYCPRRPAAHRTCLCRIPADAVCRTCGFHDTRYSHRIWSILVLSSLRKLTRGQSLPELHHLLGRASVQ